MIAIAVAISISTIIFIVMAGLLGRPERPGRRQRREPSEGSARRKLLDDGASQLSPAAD